MHYRVIALIEVTKIRFLNREILETTFNAIAMILLLGEIRLKCTAEVGDFRVLFNLQ